MTEPPNPDYWGVPATDTLLSTDEFAPGAGWIGVAPIPGLTPTGEGALLQDVLAEIGTQLYAAQETGYALIQLGGVDSPQRAKLNFTGGGFALADDGVELSTNVSLLSATEAQRGINRFATSAETTSGSSTSIAVHPAGLKTELDKKLNLSGGTLTGPLVLNADPTNALHPATKQYTDTKLPLAGGTLTNFLTLHANPTANLHAVPKQYADTKLPLAGGTLTGALTLAADPTAALQAATKQYTDTKLPFAGGSLTGFLTLHADPTGAMHAVTKQYVDAARAGLDVKDSARAATTAALPAHTRSGNDLTASANGALPAQDTVTLGVNDRLAVKDEGGGTHLENGLYYVVQLGSASTPWILRRTVDADSSAEVNAGMFVFVEEGATWADTGWVLSTNNPITLNTTALTFTQFSQADVIQAGSGLSKSGNVLSVSGVTDSMIAAGAAIAKSKLAALGIVDADVAAGAAIAESKLNLASDAAVGTASRRTLGTGAQQAAPGTHVGSGGTAHATAIAGSPGVAGFISGPNQEKLDGIQAGAQVNPTATQIINATEIATKPGTDTLSTYPDGASVMEVLAATAGYVGQDGIVETYKVSNTRGVQHLHDADSTSEWSRYWDSTASAWSVWLAFGGSGGGVPVYYYESPSFSQYTKALSGAVWTRLANATPTNAPQISIPALPTPPAGYTQWAILVDAFFHFGVSGATFTAFGMEIDGGAMGVPRQTVYYSVAATDMGASITGRFLVASGASHTIDFSVNSNTAITLTVKPCVAHAIVIPVP